MVGREAFLMKSKHKMSFIPISRRRLWCPIMKKEKTLLCESVFVLIKKQTLKNCKKKSLSYEFKGSMSFIPMSKMSLWCPIMEKKIIM